MRADSPQWRQMGPAATPQEQQALDLFRDVLPEAPTTHAWANLTFIEGGRLSEVDVVLLLRSGLYLVELKGWHGSVVGGQQVWRRTIEGRRLPDQQNPLLLAESKAKRLWSLLASTAGKAGIRATIPRVQAVTVMHGAGSVFDLDEAGATSTYALDGAGVKGLPPLSGLLAAAPLDLKNVVDKQRAGLLVKVFAAADLMPAPKQRMVGHYAVDTKNPLAEGDSWVDVQAVHPLLPDERRRIRIYDVPLDASPQQRAAIKNTAKREYLITNGLSHPGVVKALEYLEPEDIPTLIFPDDGTAQRLDEWLDAKADEASLETRLALVRRIAEVMRYAHGRGVQHRALSPAKVRVSQADDALPIVTVRDWQTGRQADVATLQRPTALRGTQLDVDTRDQRGLLYLAPEVFAERPDAVALDVYGLGALTYLLLTTMDPAPNLPELANRLAHGGLDPAVDLDDLTEGLVRLVRRATDPKVLARTPSVEAFLADLDAAEAELRDEATDIRPPDEVDPLDAGEADLVGDWMVEKRLGSGSTGVALLVTDGAQDSPSLVLKVAHDSAKAPRLAAEAAALRKLDSPRIVQLVDGPFDILGRTCLLLADAGRPTLAERLRSDGALTLEQLEKFGRDLFEAAIYLDRQGVFHRDLKPDNLGVRPDPGDRRPRLVLFDFSLAEEPLEAIGSGTAPYLDPFLGPPRRPRYDSAAERFAVAVTLFEMAAGRLPEWGDGLSLPAAIGDEVTVVPAMFDPAVGDQLCAFFTRALARDATHRFGDLTEMAEAWFAVFAAITVPEDEAEQDQAARDAAAEAASPATPVEDAGLTPRAVSALRRLGAETVGDVVALRAMDIFQMPGIGVEVRREIQARRAAWIARLVEALPTDDGTDDGGRGVEDLMARLVPRANGKNVDAVTLGKLVTGALPPEGDALPPWPTWGQYTAAAGLTGAAAAESLRAAWSRLPVVALVRDEVFEIVAGFGGVATADEVARVLLNRHGSTAAGEARMAHARVLVRAATEVSGDDAWLEVARGHDDMSPVLLALADLETDVATRLDAVRTLAAEVDRVVDDSQKVVGRAASQRVVSEHPAAPSAEVPDPVRLLAVSAAASERAAVSPRGELYPIGLEPSESLRAVLGGAVRMITLDGLTRRVAERFPRAATLPPRPALDTLVESVAPALHWRDGAYTRASTTGTVLRTATRYTAGADLGSASPDEVDLRLRESLQAHTGLVLGVGPRALDLAPPALARRYGVRTVDVTALLLTTMRSVAEAGNVDWSVVVRADAEPADSRDRQRLGQLVARALDQCWPQLEADTDPLLLTDLAPLARYGQLDRLAAITDLTVTKAAARWLLVPLSSAAAAPTLEGHPVPLAAGGWLALHASLLTEPVVGGAVGQ